MKGGMLNYRSKIVATSKSCWFECFQVILFFHPSLPGTMKLREQQTVNIMTVLSADGSSNGSCWPLYYSELQQVALLGHLFQTTLFQSSFATRQPIVIAKKTVLILPLTERWLPLIRTKHFLFRVPRMLCWLTQAAGLTYRLWMGLVSSFYQWM